MKHFENDGRKKKSNQQFSSDDQSKDPTPDNSMEAEQDTEKTRCRC